MISRRSGAAKRGYADDDETSPYKRPHIMPTERRRTRPADEDNAARRGRMRTDPFLDVSEWLEREMTWLEAVRRDIHDASEYRMIEQYSSLVNDFSEHAQAMQLHMFGRGYARDTGMLIHELRHNNIRTVRTLERLEGTLIVLQRALADNMFASSVAAWYDKQKTLIEIWIRLIKTTWLPYVNALSLVRV